MPVGNGVTCIVATDGTVNDEGWLEVFQAGRDAVAVVQALMWNGSVKCEYGIVVVCPVSGRG